MLAIAAHVPAFNMMFTPRLRRLYHGTIYRMRDIIAEAGSAFGFYWVGAGISKAAPSAAAEAAAHSAQGAESRGC
jgi:hypothetical protein